MQWWTAIWTMVGAVAAVVGAFAIIFAALQLRFHAWLEAQRVWTEKDFVEARGRLFEHFGNQIQAWPDSIEEDGEMVCRRIDMLAHLTKPRKQSFSFRRVPPWKARFWKEQVFVQWGFIPRDKVLKEWGNPIAKAWLMLENKTVKKSRKKDQWCEKWWAFQQLGEDAVQENSSLKAIRDGVLSQGAKQDGSSS